MKSMLFGLLVISGAVFSHKSHAGEAPPGGHPAEAPPDGSGLAARYPNDKDLDKDPKVVLFTDFESGNWLNQWSGGKRPTVSVVTGDEERKFESLQNQALRIKVPEGQHYGASIRYDFGKRHQGEPEAIYFRYYLRFGDDWNPERGGKLPGIAGTYGRAGWGGRPSNGSNGWSARGQFSGQKKGKTPIGFYCYHADMKGKYGNGWVWEKDGLGGLENNRWYCIEQYVGMNTPKKNDGILRGWVDGKLVFEKTDVRMRDIPDLKIECIWIDLYHGGNWSAESDNHLFIDNVVVAEEYIGPMTQTVRARESRRSTISVSLPHPPTLSAEIPKDFPFVGRRHSDTPSTTGPA